MNENHDCSYVHCIMCYKIFQNQSKVWIIYPKKTVETFISKECMHLKYMQWTMQRLQLNSFVKAEHKEENELIRICDHCSVYIRKQNLKTSKRCKIEEEEMDEGSFFQELPPSLSKNHPTQNMINFIIKGGVGHRPSKILLTSYIDSFMSKKPSNPIFDSPAYRNLQRMVTGIQSHSEIFSVSIYEYEKSLCFVKWMLCGSSRFIKDPKLAKCVRKYFGHFPEHRSWLLSYGLPSACRKCSSKSKPANAIPSSVSYQLYLWTSGSPDPYGYMEAKLKETEENLDIQDFVSFFCDVCCQTTIISYEYNTAIEKLLKIKPMYNKKKEDMNEYYIRMISECQTSTQ